MLKKIIFFLVIFSCLVSATTIQGKVYDPYLNILENSVVSVNTEPKQMVIAKDGSYSLDLPEGKYLLTASYINSEVYSWEESITVKQEGIYNLDLVLQEQLEIEELPEDFEEIFPEEKIDWKWVWLGILAAALAIAVIKFKPQKKFIDEDDFAQKVLEIIKSEKGRTTQKDIRKKLGVSEAKVSLVISDLENQKKIRKIKKGRGNIIVLN